jgi:hypothetical protein
MNNSESQYLGTRVAERKNARAQAGSHTAPALVLVKPEAQHSEFRVISLGKVSRMTNSKSLWDTFRCKSSFANKWSPLRGMTEPSLASTSLVILFVKAVPKILREQHMHTKMIELSDYTTASKCRVCQMVCHAHQLSKAHAILTRQSSLWASISRTSSQ